MAPPIPPVPVQTPLLDNKSASGVSWQWLNWLKDLRDRALDKPSGPYADDTAAKAAGVNIGEEYFTPAGAVMVRLT